MLYVCFAVLLGHICGLRAFKVCVWSINTEDSLTSSLGLRLPFSLSHRLYYLLIHHILCFTALR